MRRYVIKIFPELLVSFIVGVGIASFLPEKYLQNDLLFFSLALIFLIGAIFFIARDVRAWTGIRFFLIAMFLCLGLWRFSLSEISLAQLSLRQFVGREVKLTALIASEPQRKGEVYQAQLDEISIDGGQVRGKALVKLANSDLEYGDSLRLACHLTAPEPIEDFRYDRFLARDDIVALCQRPWVQARLEPSASINHRLVRKILTLKRYWRESLLASLPYEEASLIAGIMLGDGYLMTTELKNNYSRTGMTHIIAISGLNMTLIALFFDWLLLRLGLWRRQAYWLTLFLLWLYIVLIGAPSSAVRASIMSSLALTSVAFGRLSDIKRLLYLASAVMIALNPRILRDDVGFQLSVLALLSLVLFQTPISEYLADKLKIVPSWIRESLAVTFSAQILVMPILATNFNQLSLISPLANLFALWIVAPLMIFSALGLLLTIFVKINMVWYPAFILAKLLNWQANFFGNISWASLSVNNWSLVLTFVYYICIIYVSRKKLYVSNTTS